MAANPVGFSTNLDDVVTRTLEDVKNLECQIQRLLKTMEVAENLDDVDELQLPEPKPLKEGEKAEARMEWGSAPQAKRARKGGKAFPVASVKDSDRKEDLSDLDVMELCINENVMKYTVVEDSVFFVPVLDKCVFGMTLRNATNMRLKAPSVSVSLVPSNSPIPNERFRQSCRSFLYNVQVKVKDVNPQKFETAKGISYQDAFLDWSERRKEAFVMAGCEVFVAASFPYPSSFLQENEFSLLATVFLDGQQLWSRKACLSSHHFSAGSIDFAFRKHHSDILMAIGSHHQAFKMERILSQDGKTPKQLFEKFLLPLGYEFVGKNPNGIDSFVEVYASHQPSLYWGSFFKIETSSRKPSIIRCLVSARSEEQMRLLYQNFLTWLRKEAHRERRHGTGSGPRVSALRPKTNVSINSEIDSEVQLIIRLQYVKSLKEKGNGASRQKRKNYACGELGTVDSNWIYEYCSCLSKTDKIFVRKWVQD